MSKFCGKANFINHLQVITLLKRVGWLNDFNHRHLRTEHQLCEWFIDRFHLWLTLGILHFESLHSFHIHLTAAGCSWMCVQNWKATKSKAPLGKLDAWWCLDRQPYHLFLCKGLSIPLCPCPDAELHESSKWDGTSAWQHQYPRRCRWHRIRDSRHVQIFPQL